MLINVDISAGATYVLEDGPETPEYPTTLSPHYDHGPPNPRARASTTQILVSKLRRHTVSVTPSEEVEPVNRPLRFPDVICVEVCASFYLRPPTLTQYPVAPERCLNTSGVAQGETSSTPNPANRKRPRRRLESICNGLKSCLKPSYALPSRHARPFP